MKNLLITLVLVGLIVFGYSEYKTKNDLNKSNNQKSLSNLTKASDLKAEPLTYRVRGRYKKTTSQKDLQNAKTLEDFITDYPTTWIDNYTSVIISCTVNGEQKQFKSKNNKLTKEQIEALSSIEAATEIEVEVNYLRKNAVLDSMESRKISSSLMVLPAKAASFNEGPDLLQEYLKGKLENEILKKSKSGNYGLLINFSIDKFGKVSSANIELESKFPELDEYILNQIRNMPLWNPALNTKGNPVAHDFQLIIGNGGGC